MQTLKSFKHISGMKVAMQVVDTDKKAGEKAVMTHVSFDVDDTAGAFDTIMLAFANGHAINVTFDSPQAALDVDTRTGEIIK